MEDKCDCVTQFECEMINLANNHRLTILGNEKQLKFSYNLILLNQSLSIFFINIFLNHTYMYIYFYLY